ncbi:homoserine kinase [Nocardioides albertanoniae]|uniref:Homoserine kinase n=1 Tax=Nocardioides albertanoniae TaxID=1175486 RepID=A0A543A4L1_9ACTN|nr:homoserine kinase [Nocardioides albertanoniae]TQL67478.1 homoserine kinase [Nocardioides albertanoniae]
MTFVEGPVTVTVPATSANLGPGYDSLGLALDLRDELTGEILTSEGLEVTVEGAGEGSVPLDESHLVVRSMRAAFEVIGKQPPGLRLHCRNRIPHARGMGSSSAAIIGGLVLARALVAGGELILDDDTLFRTAAEIEGHPDNVAPAFYGGFTIAGEDDASPTGSATHCFAVRTAVDPRISVVVFVPVVGVETKTVRGLLPETVPHADAAADAGRSALLVAALSDAPEHLYRATRDFLHQEYRRPAMPESLALVDELRADGVAAIVSGAGPTVLAFSSGVESAETTKLAARCPAGWTCHSLNVDIDGVRIL